MCVKTGETIHAGEQIGANTRTQRSGTYKLKKYLMTWYGMTDFRASLGLEQTTGPVLGALLAEDYTDVVILGFTRPVKIESNADDVQPKIAATEGVDPAAARQCMGLFFKYRRCAHAFQ
ncbi:hypothetical protein LNP24_28085 [Klebsiella pneumoniae subsp. pneumoniae]|nr:hypothetical protein [Klebsiella pneumoniae subsp. pneumoniae]